MKRVLNISCKMRKCHLDRSWKWLSVAFLEREFDRERFRGENDSCVDDTCAHRKLKSLMPRPRETSNALLVEIRVESHHFDTHDIFLKVKNFPLRSQSAALLHTSPLSSNELGRLNIKQTIKKKKTLDLRTTNQPGFIRPRKKNKIKFEESLS